MSSLFAAILNGNSSVASVGNNNSAAAAAARTTNASHSSTASIIAQNSYKNSRNFKNRALSIQRRSTSLIWTGLNGNIPSRTYTNNYHHQHHQSTACRDASNSRKLTELKL